MEEDLEMSVEERHQSQLARQIHEGVEIELNKADILLNSKSEWNSSKIPRIVIECGEDQEKDEDSGMTRGIGSLQSRKLKIRAGKKRPQLLEENR